MTIFYDMSRLVERSAASHATGVDRVDLRYALWFRRQAATFVALWQTEQGMRVLPEEAANLLLDTLSVRWLAEGDDPREDTEVMPEFSDGSHALAEKFRRIGFGDLVRERGVVAALYTRCIPASKAAASFPAGEWCNGVYVNIGHCLRFEAAMAGIPDGMRRLFFLHDVIPLTHPETQRASSRAHFERFCGYVARPESTVVMSSAATAQALGALAEPLRSAFRSITPHVIPLAVEDRFLHPLRPSVVSAQPIYFLVVGTMEPRKNLELLLEVWRRLSAGGRKEQARLIWVGKLGWVGNNAVWREFRRLVRCGQAELRSGVRDEELRLLMAGCRAMLFPSRAEGWGLPLTEALGLGVPVIAADLPVLREVGQGVPDFAGLDDTKAWEHLVREYLRPDSTLRLQQTGRLGRYKPVRWDDHFAGLRTVL